MAGLVLDEFPLVEPTQLVSERARSALRACRSSDAFTLVVIRQGQVEDLGTCDVVITTCVSDEVPSRNEFGIRGREPVALVFPHDDALAPQARMLRPEFPDLPHTNHVPEGHPVALCLYFESWTATKRQWTAEKFLRRIVWWLTLSAQGALHRTDQDVEQVYFDSPYRLVLPPSFDAAMSDPNMGMCVFQVDGEHAPYTYRVVIGDREEITRLGRSPRLTHLCSPEMIHPTGCA